MNFRYVVFFTFRASCRLWQVGSSPSIKQSNTVSKMFLLVIRLHSNFLALFAVAVAQNGSLCIKALNSWDYFPILQILYAQAVMSGMPTSRPSLAAQQYCLHVVVGQWKVY